MSLRRTLARAGRRSAREHPVARPCGRRCTTILLALVLSLSGPVGAAPSEQESVPGGDALTELVDRAWAAYQEGDYRTAAARFRVLAEEGIVTAQTNLSYMYAFGQGVPRDLEASARWLRRAAEAGHPPAQAALGAYYYHGEGVTRDPVAAWAWFALAGAGGYRMAEAYQARVGEELDAAELEQARRLADDLYTRFGVRRRWW